ncbi:class I SAM-dependent methyltransferase [Chitinophaga horti]|uniref:Class I SAM-dependent methyltransferase n=1 Tax=Chitinophaga horti TaxID=2920382 RepID=A0ABY6J872_9BACT|nr:class I SAM-dependent methyltransferase [Chitinophaga horti]UYQ95900.1 class I SAM-dependent methyltransferase [Chitinophaga horti]
MVSSDFKPSVFHPYYFIRKGLVSKIQEYSGAMKGKMLDFGCGSKPYRAFFNVQEYVGVDFVNPGHPHDNEQIDVMYDGKTIPIADNTFDSALSSEVFEHVFNLEDILKELHRVLKPGGTMLITCPFVWKEHEVPNDYARYTHFALKHLFEKNGFTVKTLDKSGNFVEVLHQLTVLYFYDHWYMKLFKKIPLINYIFFFFFIVVPNIGGTILSSLLPKHRQMYLNNVILVEKNA